MGNPEQVRSLIDRCRVGEHEGQQLAIDLLVEGVDLVIARDDGAGTGFVVLDKGRDGVVQHGPRDLAHAGDVDERFEGGLIGRLQRNLGDSGGMVRHALEIGDDVDHRGDGAEIARHRRLRRNHQERLLLGPPAVLVDCPVVGHDLLRHRHVPLHESDDRVIDCLVDHAGHGDHAAAQVIELLAVVLACHWGISSRLFSIRSDR
ncbi:MAG: hypothetical protein K0R44_2430 [Thermomicrobiales bacterium]|nr:hypothetical protein [Thermomicrobiales bacterium]